MCIGRTRGGGRDKLLEPDMMMQDSNKHVGGLCLLKPVQILSFLLVFAAAGIIIGLTTSSHINYYFPPLKPHPYLNFNLIAPPPPPPPNTSSSSINIIHCSNQTETQLLRIDPLSMETFLHPTNLTHRMSDRELFWKATMVSRSKHYPFKRVPKVAFMFLTRGPLPLLPLWEKFFKGHDKALYSIYVHALPGFRLDVPVHSPFHGRQIPSQHVRWGTPELTDAERRLLANALLDFSNERFILLSESCIPIYNFTTVYNYLTGSKHSFVESYDDPTRYGRGRYSRSMLPHIRLRHWRKGSQWFELNRDLATYVVSDTDYYPLFKSFCKPACYPDEHYIPTYLNMFHGWKNSNRSITWVDWSVRASHPATFEEGNITADFVRSIRNNGGTPCLYNSEETMVCSLFARKFAPSTLKPLLDLASTVMGFYSG